MVRAKFKVMSVQVNHDGGIAVRAKPVYNDGTDENEQFWKFTPSGELTLHLSKDAPARPSFHGPDADLAPGAVFYLDMMRCPEQPESSCA